VEFSKKLLYFSWLVTLILTTVSILFSVKCLPTDSLNIITPLAWAETGTATAYYYWKAKNENRAKYAQKFIRGLADELDIDSVIRVAEIVLKD
jgi:hypothetical protein